LFSLRNGTVQRQALRTAAKGRGKAPPHRSGVAGAKKCGFFENKQQKNMFYRFLFSKVSFAS
jgi:hypothetical protein